MGSDALKEKLEEVINDCYSRNGEHEFTEKTVREIALKSFELGKAERKNKVDDNPYHIDHKRQTKLEL